DVLLGGGRLVDDDLVSLRPTAGDKLERIEPGLAPGDAEAKVRCAAVDDRLAVLADQLRLAVDAAVGFGDVGQGANLLQERLVERRSGDAAVAGQVEGRLPADDDVRPLPRLEKDRVERVVDRVGEDIRTADGRDAQDDR